MPTIATQTGATKAQIAAKAIQFAADETGVDFNYLLQTAKRESAFNPNAKAKTSSATGLFQFIRQTWYETVQKFGSKHGYENYSQFIKQDDKGRYFVPNQQAKTAILELRKDPKAASLMAAEFSKQNIQYLSNKIGRAPIASELYMAHFMGRGSAAKLISLNERAPDVKADQVFPKQATANKPIFYYKGQARSIGEVYQNLAKHHISIATKQGLDPKKLENVVKLVPFLPGNDGFFGSLFGQAKPNVQPKAGQFAYTGIGSNSSNLPINSLLMAQLAAQNKPSESPKPLPETFNAYNSASISSNGNMFSLTKK